MNVKIAITSAEIKYGHIILLKLIPLFRMAMISVFIAIFEVKKITEIKTNRRSKQRCKIWNEIQVIIKNNCLDRSLLLHEIVDFLSKVKNNCNCKYQNKAKEESTKEFPDNITINKLDLQRIL